MTKQAGRSGFRTYALFGWDFLICVMTYRRNLHLPSFRPRIIIAFLHPRTYTELPFDGFTIFQILLVAYFYLPIRDEMAGRRKLGGWIMGWRDEWMEGPMERSRWGIK
jgi:hypothetical protein